MDKIQKIKEALNLFVKSININDLSDKQKEALNSLITFWNNENINQCSVNDFYDVKDYHYQLNGEFLANKHPLYTEYKKLAMDHRMGLSANSFFSGLNAIRQLESTNRRRGRR